MNIVKTFKVLIVAYLFFIINSSLAQELKRFVKDKNGDGISYASIEIPGKSFGINSDDKDAFSFKITSEKIMIHYKYLQ